MFFFCYLPATSNEFECEFVVWIGEKTASFAKSAVIVGLLSFEKKMFVLWLVKFCFCFILVAHFHYYFMHFSKAPRKQDCVFNGKEWINLNL